MNKSRPVKGTELGGTRTFVPGAEYGNQQPNVGGGGTGSTSTIIIVPSVDADFGAVGAVFQNQTTAIEVASGGLIYVKTPKIIVSAVCGFLPGLTDSIQFDVWLSTYAGMPTISAANSICGGNYPTISAANESKNTLVGWNTSVPADSWVAFFCRSRNTPRWAVIVLDCTETT